MYIFQLIFFVLLCVVSPYLIPLLLLCNAKAIWMPFYANINNYYNDDMSITVDLLPRKIQHDSRELAFEANDASLPITYSRRDGWL